MDFPVIPAKAGIQEEQEFLDPGFRQGDGLDGSLRDHRYPTLLRHLRKQP
jgi:hypothetical protein